MHAFVPYDSTEGEHGNIFIRSKMVNSAVIGSPAADLHPYFPDPTVCQTWKSVWLTHKLSRHAEQALSTMGQYVNVIIMFFIHIRLNKVSSMRVDTKPLLDAYKDAVNLGLKLSKVRLDRIPPELLKEVDVVQTKMNTVSFSFTLNPYFM